MSDNVTFVLTISLLSIFRTLHQTANIILVASEIVGALLELQAASLLLKSIYDTFQVERSIVALCIFPTQLDTLVKKYK